ncbi:hypothetical protein NDU88_007921 [Pleurodeles waltl]|uniref:Secreted protein n=1 Tax=Pleurodeles waltl TaxID=8319 RepID=A0AAV7VR32_PLEWA|nr:hypothetical protein NDU88_007921 [Pleurodeles waltl]
MHSPLVLRVLLPFTSWTQDVVEIDSRGQTHNNIVGQGTGDKSEHPRGAPTILGPPGRTPHRTWPLSPVTHVGQRPAGERAPKQPQPHSASPPRSRSSFSATPPRSPFSVRCASPACHAGVSQFSGLGKASHISAIPDIAPSTVPGTNHSRHLQVASATVYGVWLVPRRHRTGYL